MGFVKEYSEYYLIKRNELFKILPRIKKASIFCDKIGKWVIFAVDTAKNHLYKYVELAIAFEDHEGSAWKFGFYHQGKIICGALIGEHGETGVELEGNYREGDFKKMASLLKLEIKAVKKLFNSEKPDVKYFTEIMGFEIIRSNAFLLENPPII